MIFKSTIISTLLLLSPSLSWAGDIAGNGGQIVVCSAPLAGEISYQPEAGIYSLDYIQFRDSYEYYEPVSLDDSFDRIEEMLELLPKAQASFKEYRRLIKNTSYTQGKRIWTLSSLELIEIRDTATLRKLPVNCRHQEANDAYGAFQIIVRRVAGDAVFYEAYSPYLDKIEELPLQASFLYVHEWLWDFAKDAYQSRRANVLLHGIEATPEEVAASMRIMGLTMEPVRERPAQPRPVETNHLGMSFAWIPAGTFLMGSPSSEDGRFSHEAQHRVTISSDFFMQTTEVTQEQWFKVMGDNPSKFIAERDCPGEYKQISGVALCPNNPVEQVSWHDAQLFINKMNERRDGFRYRLPTEAEWEYAARGGSTGPYSVAGNLADFAWFDGNAGDRTHAVAKLKPNAYGLYDVHGNVWEWVSDWYGDYPSSNVTDPVGASSGSRRVLRGGSWRYPALLCRSAYRDYWRPDSRNSHVGFRLLRMPSP